MGANRSCDWLPRRSCKWELALAQFLEAYHYAKDLKQPVWDFAVDLSRLEAAGLTDNDFRWLIAKGYIEQAVELGGSGVRMKRRFRATAAISFSRRTCFVLTKAGFAFANRVYKPQAEDERHIRDCRGSPDTLLARMPRWDSASRTLWVGSTLVKQFKVPASNQELVLNAFAEEGWPPCIDNPLPPFRDIAPKRRLHDTITRLNRSHSHSLVRFHGIGRGLAVRWELVHPRKRSTPDPR